MPDLAVAREHLLGQLGFGHEVATGADREHDGADQR